MAYLNAVRQAGLFVLTCFVCFAQCGKVENGLFIMDYNPRVITAAQAFATAVTTFDRKSLPFLMRPFKSTAFINSPLQ